MAIISNFPGSKAKGTAKGTALTQDVLKGKTFSGNAGVDLTGELYVGRGAVAPSELSPWTLRTSAADNDWQSVTYGNGLFVAVASSGTGNRVMTARSIVELI